MKKIEEREEEQLLLHHAEFWEREMSISEGRGVDMEWERRPLILTEGYGCENTGKRLYGKKIRWTEEAKEVARKAGVLDRIVKKAGRRLQGEQRRRRLELGRKRRAELLETLQRRKDNKRRAATQQLLWRTNQQFKKMTLKGEETMVQIGACPPSTPPPQQPSHKSGQ